MKSLKALKDMQGSSKDKQPIKEKDLNGQTKQLCQANYPDYRKLDCLQNVGTLLIHRTPPKNFRPKVGYSNMTRK